MFCIMLFRWYIGEVGEDASTIILRNCERDNVFVVHKSPSTNDYRLSIRLVQVISSVFTGLQRSS